MTVAPGVVPLEQQNTTLAGRGVSTDGIVTIDLVTEAKRARRELQLMAEIRIAASLPSKDEAIARVLAYLKRNKFLFSCSRKELARSKCATKGDGLCGWRLARQLALRRNSKFSAKSNAAYIPDVNLQTKAQRAKFVSDLRSYVVASEVCGSHLGTVADIEFAVNAIMQFEASGADFKDFWQGNKDKWCNSEDLRVILSGGVYETVAGLWRKNIAYEGGTAFQLVFHTAPAARAHEDMFTIDALLSAAGAGNVGILEGGHFSLAELLDPTLETRRFTEALENLCMAMLNVAWGVPARVSSDGFEVPKHHLRKLAKKGSIAGGPRVNGVSNAPNVEISKGSDLEILPAVSLKVGKAAVVVSQHQQKRVVKVKPKSRSSSRAVSLRCVGTAPETAVSNTAAVTVGLNADGTVMEPLLAPILAVDSRLVCEQLSTKVGTCIYLTRGIKDSFREVLSNLLGKGEEAMVAGNQVQAELCYKKSLLMPAVVLIPHKGESKGEHRTNIRTRLDMVARDEWDCFSLDSLKQSVMAEVVAGGKVDPDPVVTPAQKRCNKLMEAGEVGRAMRTLLSDDNTPRTRPTEEVMDALRALHPAPLQADELSPVMAADTTTVIQSDQNLPPFSKAAVHGYFQRQRRLKGVGPLGLRVDHIKDILGDCCEDNEFLSRLAQFISRIAAGTLPLSTFQLLGSAILIPIPKSPAGGIRPIAMGEVLRKAAATLLSKLTQTESAEIFEWVQYGIGVTSACEFISLNLSRTLSLHEGDQWLDTALFDATNAFNLGDRVKLRSAVAKHLPVLLPYFDAFYKVPALLFTPGYLGPPILSQCGVQQGDPLGPLFFCLLVHDLFSKARLAALEASTAMHTHSREFRFGAYLDDVTVHDSHDSVLAAIKVLIHDGPEVGFVVNPRKTRILLARGLQGEALASRRLAYAQALGLRADDPELDAIVISPLGGEQKYGVKLLGVPVGSDAFIKDFISQMETGFVKDCNKLLTLKDTQKEWLLFTISLQRKWDYLFRCLPPKYTSELCKRLDAHLRKLASKILHHVLSDSEWDQSTLNFGDGGLGVRSPLVTAPLAHLACCSDFVDAMRVDKDIVFPPESGFLEGIAGSLSLLNEECSVFDLSLVSDMLIDGSSGLVPSEGNSVHSPFSFDTIRSVASRAKRGRTQEVLSSMVMGSRARDICVENDPRWKAIRGVEQGAFLSAVPKGSCKMKSSHFQTACLLRLGGKLSCVPAGLRCDCGRHVEIGAEVSHLTYCNKGGGATSRHNNVAREVAALGVYAGIDSKLEPYGCFVSPTVASGSISRRMGGVASSSKRPDIRFHRPALPDASGVCFAAMNDLLADVQVINPLLPSHVTDPLGADKDKIRKYRDECTANNFDFIPLVFEHLGGWHNDAKKLILALVSKGAMRTGFSYASALTYWRRRLSCAIQAGNAAMILGGLQRCIQSRRASSGLGLDESCWVENVELMASPLWG